MAPLRREGEVAMNRRELLKMLGAGAAATVSGGFGPLAGTPAGADVAPPQPASTVLRTRLTDRYGIAYPIVQAGMAFYATPTLAAAVTNAGGLGVLGPVPEAPEGTRRQIQETRRLTSGPFGVDFVYFPFFNKTAWAPASEHDDEHRTRNLRLRRLVLDRSRTALGEAPAGGGHPPVGAGGQRGGGAGGDRVRRRGHHRPGQAGRRPRARLPGRQPAAPFGTRPPREERRSRERARARLRRHRRRSHPGQCPRRRSRRRLGGDEFPQAYTRSIVNRVLAEWKGQEDKIPTPAPPPAVVGTARLQPWSVPGGIPYAMPKFSVIIPTRDSTGDFDEMCLLAGAESAPLIKSVKPAAEIVAEMATEAAALLAGRGRSS